MNIYPFPHFRIKSERPYELLIPFVLCLLQLYLHQMPLSIVINHTSL